MTDTAQTGQETAPEGISILQPERIGSKISLPAEARPTLVPMPDSPEVPRLSGLARSIDSLFSAPAPAPTLITPVAPDEPAAPDEAAALIEPVAAVEPTEPERDALDTRPLPPQMF